MKLSFDEIVLTTTSPDDPDIEALRQDYEVLKNLSEIHMHPAPMPGCFTFRIEKEDVMVGEASLKSIKWFNRKAEVSIFISSEHQGQGLGKQAMLALMKFAFHTMNLYRLEAEVVDYNERAKALFERLGFLEEGRLRSARFMNGAYYDIIRYGLLRPEYEKQYSTG